MNGAIFEAHSASSEQPYGLLILGFLAYATLGGFAVVEKLRTMQLESKEPIDFLHFFLRFWWVPLYVSSLPVAIIWLSFTFLKTSEYRTTPIFLVGLVFAYLLTTDWHPNLWKRIWLAPASYGIRGCAIAGLLWASLWHMAKKHPEKDLEVMSAMSFAIAAWLSCGLGSFVGWAAHPEYGEFRDQKRHMISIIQCCFISGFAFLLAAVLRDEQKENNGNIE